MTVSLEAMRARLHAAVASAPPGNPAVDEPCSACVELFGVDGAAVSTVHAGASGGRSVPVAGPVAVSTSISSPSAMGRAWTPSPPERQTASQVAAALVGRRLELQRDDDGKGRWRR